MTDTATTMAPMSTESVRIRRRVRNEAIQIPPSMPRLRNVAGGEIGFPDRRVGRGAAGVTGASESSSDCYLGDHR